MEDGSCPYDVLEIKYTADAKEIRDAKRALSRRYHPDKHASASEEEKEKLQHKFDLVIQAFNFLNNETKKALYDEKLKAREAARLRNEKRDKELRMARQDLDEREMASKRSKSSDVISVKQRKMELERVRADTARRVEAEQERQQAEAKKKAEKTQILWNVKVRWGSKPARATAYDEESLHRIFSKYGRVEQVFCPKPGRGVVAFKRKADAEAAILRERGEEDVPFKRVEWLESDVGVASSTQADISTGPPPVVKRTDASASSLDSIEAMIHAKIQAKLSQKT